jgi:DNA helicase II / ATP-dependent DNA helicase PcrA
MGHIALGQEDLEQLRLWFPALQFNRDDQVKALLLMESADFQAVPGSGKTTLLGAKLALIANKWPHAHRGICILSHTNVAKIEVENRLRSIPGGEALLVYPHFIGTIQTFVNKYLALPWLRSLGIEVREIDDEAFVERFVERAMKDYSIKPWVVVNKWAREASLRGIRYVGPQLKLETSADTELPAKGKCIDRLRVLKSEFAREGWLRFEDMFSYAEQAMQEVPGLSESVASRFPLVFIDEMQDTNDLQLNVLSKLFDDASVVQRLGDVNQSILRRGKNEHKAAFPKDGFFEVAASLRFGKEIASVANQLKLIGQNIVGEGPPAADAPALCLYSDATVTSVLERFGALVAGIFQQSELDELQVKAVCAVKRPGNAKQKIGRHILDYFPTFEINDSRPASLRKSICSLVRDAGVTHGTQEAYSKRVTAARLAVLRLLHACGVKSYRHIPTWKTLIQELSGQPQDLTVLNNLVLEVIQGANALADEKEWRGCLARMLASLGHLVRESRDADLQFEEGVLVAQGGGRNKIEISQGGRRFDLHLSTVASVKGETHLATLVLESCHNRRYDLSDLLPYLIGEALPAPATVNEQLQTQLNNLFVAVTRASRFVALAIHTDRVDAKSKVALGGVGWQILDWTR